MPRSSEQGGSHLTMREKTTAAVLVILCIAVLILFVVVQDLNRMIDRNSKMVDSLEAGVTDHHHIYNSSFFGTVLQIPKEIYYQDWVYFQGVDGRVYDKDDVLLVYEDHSEEMVLIQFPDMLDEGYLYYSYEANVSNGWWQPKYNTRHSITFEQTLLDDFNETTSADSVWQVVE